ncbi:hypothetical protein ILYODFUR_006051 [Ilyodon furcidens]|uniref:Uncharacterized protein n=1 Tax=Ilyodon furcidens TaxID=33524 RepID=A0ABV0T6W7_9TELE
MCTNFNSHTLKVECFYHICNSCLKFSVVSSFPCFFALNIDNFIFPQVVILCDFTVKPLPKMKSCLPVFSMFSINHSIKLKVYFTLAKSFKSVFWFKCFVPSSSTSPARFGQSNAA